MRLPADGSEKCPGHLIQIHLQLFGDDDFLTSLRVSIEPHQLTYERAEKTPISLIPSFSLQSFGDTHSGRGNRWYEPGGGDRLERFQWHGYELVQC